MMCRGVREGGGGYVGAFGRSRLLSLLAYENDLRTVRVPLRGQCLIFTGEMSQTCS